MKALAEKRRAAWQSASAVNRLKSKRKLRAPAPQESPLHGTKSPTTPQRAFLSTEEMEQKLKVFQAEKDELKDALEASLKKQALAQKREAETAKKLANARAALKLIQKRLNILPLVKSGGQSTLSHRLARGRERKKGKVAMSNLRAVKGELRDDTFMDALFILRLP